MQTGDAPNEVVISLERALKSAGIADGLARGLNEVARTLDKNFSVGSYLFNYFMREAHFCVLAKDCDEPSYEKLVRALCESHKIPLLEVKDKAELGEMVGQCKYDKEGKARKLVGCSCAAVKNYGRDDVAQKQLMDYFYG